MYFMGSRRLRRRSPQLAVRSPWLANVHRSSFIVVRSSSVENSHKYKKSDVSRTANY